VEDNGKFEFNYDISGNLTQEILFSWDANTNQWVGGKKYEHVYDNSYSYNDLVISDWYFEWYYDWYNTWNGLEDLIYFRHKPIYTTAYERNIYSGQLEISRKQIFYFSGQEFTGITNNSEGKIKIFPNPVTNGFIINGAEGTSKIILIDTNGKVWLSKEVASNEYIPTDNLPQGVYLVKIVTNNELVINKLVKE